MEALTPNNKNTNRNSKLTLTPKGSRTPTGQTSKLKMVFAHTPQKEHTEKKKSYKDVSARRFK